MYKLNVNGDSYFNGNIWSPTGIVTALEFHGNGSGLTNLDSIWSTPTSDADTIIPKGDGTYDSADFRVGIGTSVGVSEANLTVGPIGNLPSGVTTSLMVHHRSYFLGTADFGYDLNVSGITTLSDFDLDNSTTGRIVCGVATVGILTIGTGGTTAYDNARTWVLVLLYVQLMRILVLVLVLLQLRYILKVLLG